MTTLSGIKATGTQTFNATNDAGDTVYFTLYYKPATRVWKVDIECGDFVLNGQKLYNSLNILHQYRRIIDFGIAIMVTDGGEPFLVNDFSGERCYFCLLSADDVEEIESYYEEN